MQKLNAFVAVSILASLCAPFAANADDIVTLTYQSAPLTGTYTSAVSGLLTADPYVTAPLIGTITGSVVFDETELASSGAIGAESYSFTLTGSGSANGINIGFDSSPTPALIIIGGNCSGSATFICVNSSNGVITGASVGLLDNFFPTDPVQVSIGPQGDSASLVSGACTFGVETSTGPTYTGRTCISYLTASNSTAGKWTVTSTAAPEIDPGTAGSALTLLAGFAAMVRGRRRVAA